MQKVAEDIGSTIKVKVDEALKGATVAVQHTHSYCFERDLKEVADTRLRKRCIAFGLTSLVLASIIASIAIAYYNSEIYWGKQFNKIYTSTYLTEEERETMQRKYHTVAILPTEYHKDPSKAKEQLKRAKAILKKRKKELKKNN